MKQKSKELKDGKDKLLVMQKNRLQDKDGFDVEIEKILGDVEKIYTQAYHGGYFNGVCCIRLLDNQEKSINKLQHNNVYTTSNESSPPNLLQSM